MRVFLFVVFNGSLDGVFSQGIRHHDLDFHLRQQADVVLLAAIDGRVALLLAVPAHLGHGHARDLELLERGDVRLQGGRDDVRGEPMTRGRPLLGVRVVGAARPDEDLTLGVLAAGDRLDLVVDEDRVPAEDRLDDAVDRAIERVDRAIAVGIAAHFLAGVGDDDLGVRALAGFAVLQQGHKAELMVKYYPPRGASVKTIKAHLDKCKGFGFKPDLIIIDYADLLKPVSKRDSIYAELGGVYEEIRGLSGELGIPVWTASQTNRGAIDSEVIQADSIADSYAKVMTADFIMSVSRKAKDKLNNTARFHVMKNRFGADGLTFPAKMDTNKGIIEVYSSTSPNGIITQKESKNGELLQKQLLHKKYVENMG